MNSKLQVPKEWAALDLDRLAGTVLIIGATDTGKSCLARYLFEKSAERDRKVGFVDGDPGQSTLGPPTTITLSFGQPGSSEFPPTGPKWHRCIGSTSPSGHMLPLVSGAASLVQVAREQGAQSILYDTTGLVDPAAGGHYLKWTKVDLLAVDVVVAIQRRQELSGLLAPLRRSQRTQVIELEPAPAVRRRDSHERQQHRRRKYEQYFAEAEERQINWTDLAVFPSPEFDQNQLIALENGEGFCMALGLVRSVNSEARQLIIRSPLQSSESLDTIRLADITLDPDSYLDQYLHH